MAAHLLGGENLHLSFPTRTVLEGVSLGIDAGDRIGIVGRNGDGKSTLMKILAGRIDPDRGRVTARSGTRIGMLDQADVLDPGLTVGQAVVGDRDEHEWAGDARVRDVIGGLVADLDWQSPVRELSGGQRRRTALAGLLAQEWDVLFLDEPTNHLDVDGITWLARHLAGRWPASQGGLVVVTHDRWFLDEVSTATWEVHDRIVEAFEGGYAAYVLQRVERDRQASVTEAKRQNLMKKELAWLRRGAPARTAKPKFRIEAANQLISDVPPPRDTVELSRMAVTRLGRRVVDLEDASVVYTGSYDDEETGHRDAGEHTVLEDITWRIAPGERTGILGRNGAGKSTLLGLVTGEVRPTAGTVTRGSTVKLAVLTQQLRELDEVAAERVSDVVGRYRTSYVTGGREMTPGQLLERLGFTNEHLATPVGDLSGGQKRRLQLLLILLEEPNVLVLDEPSNDLDTDMLAAMEDLLDTWPGTLLVVSHDRYLLERVTDQQYAVLDGALRHLPGGVEEYLRLADGQQLRTSSTNPLAAEQPAGSGAGAGAGPAVSGAEARMMQKEVGAIERKLTKLREAVAARHEELAAHDQSDFEGLGAITARMRGLEDEVEELELRWLELSESLEG